MHRSRLGCCTTRRRFGSVGRGVCHGNGGQPTEGCWSYIIKSTNYIAICYIVTSHVVGDDVIGRVVFPAKEIADLSSTPRAPRAARYMAAMGLWRPQTGPGDPGLLPRCLPRRVTLV